MEGLQSGRNHKQIAQVGQLDRENPLVSGVAGRLIERHETIITNCVVRNCIFTAETQRAQRFAKVLIGKENISTKHYAARPIARQQAYGKIGGV